MDCAKDDFSETLMRRFGAYSFTNEVTNEELNVIFEQTVKSLESRLGERRPLKLWMEWNEEHPYDRIIYAIFVCTDINNTSAPCLSKTRKRIEAMYNAALKLKEIGTSYDDTESVYGNNILTSTGYWDYHEAFGDAWRAWAIKNGLPITEWNFGTFSDDITRIVDVLEIAINDVLPPKKDNYDDYPESYSPIEFLIRHLFEFYYMYVEKCEIDPVGNMPNIEKIKSKAMGTPKKPGDLFLITQDLCQTLRLGWADRPDLLRKKFYDVIRKIKKTNQNAEIEKS